MAVEAFAMAPAMANAEAAMVMGSMFYTKGWVVSFKAGRGQGGSFGRVSRGGLPRILRGFIKGPRVVEEENARICGALEQAPACLILSRGGGEGACRAANHVV